MTIAWIPHVETLITRAVLDIRGGLYRPSAHNGMLLCHFTGRPTLSGS